MNETVLPVFVRSKDIPKNNNMFPSVLEMCLAAERTAGQGTILGAQEINRLWRIYPLTAAARVKLLVQGVAFRGVTLNVCDSNPFLVRGGMGVEKTTTKLWIDGVPISVADTEIEFALTKMGCELRSDIKQERARDADHKLTRFLTGRRFVFISKPEKPLERTVKISLFEARLFHYEQKLEKKIPVCSNCLDSGHHRSQCSKEVVCRVCKLPGHKKGDKDCSMPFSNDLLPSVTSGQAGDAANALITLPAPQTSEDSARKTIQDRGRKLHRGQLSIGDAFNASLWGRSRSATPAKRHLSDKDKGPSQMDNTAKRKKDGSSANFTDGGNTESDGENPD